MRSVPISHSITGPLARSIGPGFTGAERGKALTNAGGPSGPPFGVHYRCRWDNGAFSSHFYVARTPSVPLMGQTLRRGPGRVGPFLPGRDGGLRGTGRGQSGGGDGASWLIRLDSAD